MFLRYILPRILIVVLLTLGGGYLYFFGGPYRLADRELRPQSMDHLRRYIVAHPDSSDDLETQADEYLHGLASPANRPSRSALEISLHRLTDTETAVRVMDRHPANKRLSATCDRLIFRQRGGAWILVKHQWAQQNRNQWGWTTQPTR